MQYPFEAMRPWLNEFGTDPDANREELHDLRTVVDTVFFAGLATEEGEHVHVRVAYHERGTEGLRSVSDYDHSSGGHDRTSAWEILRITGSTIVMEFSVHSLVKLAPAANLARSVVVVGPVDGRLMIQGLARRVQFDEFTVDQKEDVLVMHAPEPGHVVGYMRGIELFRYEHGEMVKPRFALHDLLNDKSSTVRRALAVMNASLVDDLPVPMFARDRVSHVVGVVRGLIENMVSKRHGGIIALSPVLERRGNYDIHPEDSTRLAKRLRDALQTRRHLEALAWENTESNRTDAPNAEDAGIAEAQKDRAAEALDAMIESVAMLTVVDNALVLGPDLQVICAGHVVPSVDAPIVVNEATDVSGNPGDPYDIGQHGARHRAAAAFASQNPGAVVFVASADGPLRCFSRPDHGNDMVLAWRIQLSKE